MTGHIKKEHTKYLLVYLFIVEAVFEGFLGNYLDDEGLAAFNSALMCIGRNGCIVSIPTSKNISRPRGPVIPIFRVDESDHLRYTEESDTRIAED